MRKIFLFILFILSCVYNYATSQVSDRLVYKGDTIAIYPFILEQYIENSTDREKIYNKIKPFLLTSTACWRGLRALFEIRNDSLFLQKAYGKEEIDLFVIFGKKDNVFVSWYSGILTSPKNCLIYEHDGWGGLYEYETDFSIRYGKLIRIQEFRYNKYNLYYINTLNLQRYKSIYKFCLRSILYQKVTYSSPMCQIFIY